MFLTRAAKEGLRTRSKAGAGPAASINVFDAARQLGFEVRFIDLPSVEGMYVRGEPPAVIISSLRPMARQIYTCAHEIGHHYLQHGEVIDGLLEKRSASDLKDRKEREADMFAAYLLMPPTAVDHAFHVRGLSYETVEHLAIYRVANYFQVGYTTLVRHLQFSLSKIRPSRAEALLRYSPSQMRTMELGQSWQGNMFLVDKFWNERAALDCEVGDIVVLPPDSIAESGALRSAEMSRTQSVVEAFAAGIAQVQIAGGARMTIRVAPKQYVGRLEFRWQSTEEAAE